MAGPTNMLLILVEGPEDEAFVEKVLAEPLRRALHCTKWKVLKYSCLTPEKVCRYIRGLEETDPVVLLGDLDNAACEGSAVTRLRQRFGCIPGQSINIVSPEIEAWCCVSLVGKAPFARLSTTNSLRKEGLADVARRHRSTRWRLCLKGIQRCNLALDRTKNTSLDHLCSRYGL